MSQYIVLSRIKVQNANCIAGFTWGFPAITHFLGFSHTLHRKLSGEYDIALGGCAVISHDYQLHAYRPKSTANYEFIQSKNPPVLAKHKKSSPSIIEEGKMNLTVSIIIEVTNELVVTSEKVNSFRLAVLNHCLTSRIAGGTILTIGRVDIFSASSQEQLAGLNRKIKRLVAPGFVLLDRSALLKQHFDQLKKKNPNSELLDAWLDFSALKYKAHPKLNSEKSLPTRNTSAAWQLLPKPITTGWLVPIVAGYKAISDCHPPGDVAAARDINSPTCFVEAVHSIGEWKSTHRITDINDVIWRYQYEEDWYLCTQNINDAQSKIQPVKENKTINFEDALASL